MNYAKINPIDIANGLGIRVSLFVQGCRKHCKGCFNQETWDFGCGTPYTHDTEDLLLNMLEPPFISGLSLLGGDPTEPENISPLLNLLKKIKELYPQKTIWIYSGDTYETLLERCQNEPDLKTMLDLCDVLVDGPFILEKKDISLEYRGSSNQRVIDLNETKKLNKIKYQKTYNGT